MPSLFVDTHNVVAILEKSDAFEGFAQIIDFLNGSYIHYVLTVSPHIYISCIKQFWNTVVVKLSGDVTRLQALVDQKKIVISEDVIREILRLDDVEGVRFNFSRYIFDSLVHNVDSSSKFYMVGKGCSGVETPLFENMLEVREVDAEEEVHVPGQDDVDQENVTEEIADDQVLDKCSALVLRVKGLESANTAQQLEIIKLKARVKKLERLNKVKSSKLRRLKKVGTSQRIESSEDEENVVAASIPIPAAKPAVVAVSTPISATKPAAKPKVLKIIPAAPAVSTRKRKGVVIRDPEEELHDDTPAETQSAKDKGKGILVKDLKPMKKKDQIEMDAEYARKLQKEEESHAQAKDVQATDVQPKDIQAKGIQYIRRYHGYKKKPQSESEARKNMIAYLKNTEVKRRDGERRRGDH
nr:hypothetical protein [Tanacetum cinerariifolium]